MIYPDAHRISINLYKRLEPFCLVADVAGSVRREARECKDIELMVCPRMQPVTNLFDEVLQTQRHPDFIKAVRSLGKIVSGDPLIGRHVKIDLHENIRLDLFIPQKQDYYRQLAIRTGSRDYIFKVLAPAWIRLGWCGTKKDGLRLISESYSKIEGRDSNNIPKKVWYCDREKPTLPPEWKDELEFFNWLQIPWLPPSKRYV